MIPCRQLCTSRLRILSWNFPSRRIRQWRRAPWLNRWKRRPFLTSTCCHQKSKNCTGGPSVSPRFACRTSGCCVPRTCGSGARTRTCVSDCVTTLRTLTKNTIAGSNPSSLIQWITFMTGWWKYWAAEIRKRLASIPTPLPSCAGSANALAGKSVCFHILTGVAAVALLACAAPLTSAQTPAHSSKKHAAKSATNSAASSKPAPAATATGADLLEKQLAQLARALRDNPNATTYAALSAFASRNTKNETGARAALALGYYDLTREKPDLSLGWMRKAVGEKLLRDYVLYWQAQASLALGQKDSALEQFQSILRDFPDSGMTEQTVTALAQTALALGNAPDALAAL